MRSMTADKTLSEAAAIDLSDGAPFTRKAKLGSKGKSFHAQWRRWLLAGSDVEYGAGYQKTFLGADTQTGRSQ